MKTGIIMPNWIGDAVMATPALRAIRDADHSNELVAIHRPVIGAVLAGLDLVDRTIIHDPKGRGMQSFRFFAELRRERFNRMILFTNSWRSAWWAWLSGARERIGFQRDGRELLLTKVLKPVSRTEPNPVLDEYNRLAVALGGTKISRTMELSVELADETAWEKVWDKHPGLDRSNYVCLNPGGAFGAAKHWPVESFAALAGRIADREDCSVMVLCGPAEREMARQIARQANDLRVISLADEPVSVGLTKAMVRRSRLLVTTDSGPRHFAAPFGIPAISLYGPTHIAWSRTGYDREVHLQHRLECGPCQQRVCPLGHHDCMRQLSVERVEHEVQRVLHEWKSAARSAA